MEIGAEVKTESGMHMTDKEKTKVKVTYDDHRTGYILKENLTICPECGEQSVRAKEMFEGGGVVCISDTCTYWFCY